MVLCMGYYFLGMNQNGAFGRRLAELRKAKGFTQQELAKNIGTSQRMIAHYERHVKRPPLEKLERMAHVLDVSLNELLGVAPIKKQPGAPKDAYLQRKIQKVKELTKQDQKLVINMIDSLSAKRAAS